MKFRILFALLIPSLALAQPDDPQLRAKVRDRVRQAVVERLASTLALDPPTAQRFRAVLDSFDAQIAELQRDNGAAYKELKQLSDGGHADQANVYRLADRMLGNREKIAQLESQRAHEVRQVLTPQKYAELILAAPKVQKEVRKELWKAMAKPGEQPQFED
jgi:Spy/CpxP family protein refolding chaperone